MSPAKNACGALAAALLALSAAAAHCAETKLGAHIVDIHVSTVPVTPELEKNINAEVPPQAPPVVKAPETGESAVGPGFTVIPLPAFVYNRNEGSWVGGLVPIFRANTKGEVEDIYAPLYLHNKLIGETVTFNYFGYRHKTTQYHIVLSRATKIEYGYEASYKNTAVRDGLYIFAINANTGKSAFQRFFGLGNNTSEQFETQFTMRDSNFIMTGGIHVTDDLAVLARERYRGVQIENGASPTLPQTKDSFPDLPGVVNSPDVVGHALVLSYDTRDNQLTPLQGTFATLLGEYDQNVEFGDRNRWWRLTAEARHYFPHHDFQAVFVSHVLFDAIIGQDQNTTAEDTIQQNTGAVDGLGNPIFEPIPDKRSLHQGVPFYERPTLGGENSLRGFGRGRFVSNFAYLVNLEERFSLIRKTIMGNLIELEAAPFLDIGRVSRTVDEAGFVRRIQINPGAGLRLLARPNIAGRLDVGYGKDGANVFVGLDYPF